MTSPPHTHDLMALAAAIVSSIILSISQVYLKAAVSAFGSDFSVLRLDIAIERGVIGHIAAIGTSSAIGLLLWIYAIRSSNLTDLYWTTAICYIAVPLFSMVFLRESLSTKQVLSYLLITAGIISLR